MTAQQQLDQLWEEMVRWRHALREALYPYYPNNPLSTDEELFAAVKEMADQLHESSPHVKFWREQAAARKGT